MIKNPALFGIHYSNRDFTSEEGWSKNNFNATFPAALACYMYTKSIDPVYLVLNREGKLVHSHINVDDLFGLAPLDSDLFFAFESDYIPYQQLIVGSLPRIDLVTLQRSTSLSLRGIEIKLTALPDNSTYHLVDDEYGCEIVIRPDTIVYLALSIAFAFKDRRAALLELLIANPFQIRDWNNGEEILPFLPLMVKTLTSIMKEHFHLQHPLLMQPIWKTQGKKPILHENAFDIFVWSNFAFTQLFFYVITDKMTRISRQARSIIWLMKMLLDYAEDGKINHTRIIDELSHATKNDKAFSVPGRITRHWMACPELTTPRIERTAIKSIILGGGQHLLSPERRLDAAILSSLDLFE